MLVDLDPLLSKLLARAGTDLSFLELERWSLVADGVFLGDGPKLLARLGTDLSFLELEWSSLVADGDFLGVHKVDGDFLGDDGTCKVDGVFWGDPGRRNVVGVVLGDKATRTDVGVFSGDADLVGLFGVPGHVSADSVVFSESLSIGNVF